MEESATIKPIKVDQNSKLGKIPEGWKLKALDEIGIFFKGKGISKSDVLEPNIAGYAGVRYAEIYTKYHYYTDDFYSKINQESANNSNEIITGDILFAGSGETLEDIGKSIAYLGSKKAYAGGDIIVFRQENQDSKYLGYLLNNDSVRAQLHKLGQGHSVVHIYAKSLKKLKILIPPILEQQKIARILNTWDKAIVAQEELINEKQALKKGLMQQMLTGEKRFPEFKDVWKEFKLDTVCTFKNGKGHEQFIDMKGKFVVVNSKFISTNGIVRKYTNNQATPLFKNDIVMVMSDVPNGKALAKCYLINEADKFSLNQRICSLTAKNVNTKFLYFQLNRNKFYLKFNDGLTQTNLKKKEVLDCPIILPSLEEQEKIVATIEASNNILKLAENGLKIIVKQKQGLMQQLLTGEKRVKI